MNRSQKILLGLMVLNLIAILLFSPFDDYSVTNNDIAIFGGFRFAFGQPGYAMVNFSLLYLEVAIVLVNAGILWLVTQENRTRRTQETFNYRKATLIVIAVNLLVIMLFPPFEYISNMTRATIPTFEGFYFIFTAPPYRVIVTPVLYLEAMFVLVNGGLLLLAFKQRKPRWLDPGQTAAFMADIHYRSSPGR